MRLRCDWNYTSFCVTSFKYNRTQFNWDKVKQHLLNQGNISVDIQDLQQDILKAFNKHLDVIFESDFLDTVADNFSSINPIKQIKTFGYGIALIMEVLLITCVFLYSLEKNDQETMRPTTVTSISPHFSSCAKSKRRRCRRQEK